MSIAPIFLYIPSNPWAPRIGSRQKRAIHRTSRCKEVELVVDLGFSENLFADDWFGVDKDDLWGVD